MKFRETEKKKRERGRESVDFINKRILKLLLFSDEWLKN